jgi:hypothetical protein
MPRTYIAAMMQRIKINIFFSSLFLHSQVGKDLSHGTERISKVQDFFNANLFAFYLFYAAFGFLFVLVIALNGIASVMLWFSHWEEKIAL